MKELPNFIENKSLRELTTFGIGGPARYFVEVREISQFQALILHCKENQLPYFVLGKGSNCLFDDRGYNGLIILNKIDFFNHTETATFHVGAGYSFSLLGTQTARKGFSGLEFASGIPGSVGGAVFMNAGANGKETCETLVSVDYINENGELELLYRQDLEFSYRTSPFQKRKGAIVGATFELTPLENARQQQIAIITYRKNTQPYGEPSAGCIFRNPHCGHAGALIDTSGLKGMTVGGAKVSELHANFIVNTGEATAKDVLALIDVIKKRVEESTNTELESEVRWIPYLENITKGDKDE